MKNLGAAIAATILALCPMAQAEEPLELTDLQMDQVTAGVGANNVATVPWGALGTPPQNFTLQHLVPADSGAAEADALGGVAVPSINPNGIPIP